MDRKKLIEDVIRSTNIAFAKLRWEDCVILAKRVEEELAEAEKQEAEDDLPILSENWICQSWNIYYEILNEGEDHPEGSRACVYELEYAKAIAALPDILRAGKALIEHKGFNWLISNEEADKKIRAFVEALEKAGVKV